MKKFFKTTILTLSLIIGTSYASEDTILECLEFNPSNYKATQFNKIKKNTIHLFDTFCKACNCERDVELYKEDWKSDIYRKRCNDRDEALIKFYKVMKNVGEKFDFSVKNCYSDTLIEIIFHKILTIKNNQFLYSRILDKILECNVSFSTDIINNLIIYVYYFCDNDKINDKIVDYLIKFINKSRSLDIPPVLLEVAGNALPSVTSKLTTVVEDKEEKFFDSLVNNINNFKVDELKNILSTLDNEEIDLYYSKNKDKIDNDFKNKIANQLSCNNYANLMKMIAYLKHNSMELAIGELLRNKVYKFFIISSNARKYEYFAKIILENGSMDEFAYFFRCNDYRVMVEKYSLSFDESRQSLKDVAFLIRHPEYNPVNIALEAGNIGIANYFIRDSESLYNADELIELSHLHKNANATKEEILALDMKAVNFSSLFAEAIKNKNFDIAYNILYSFSDDLDNYSDLSGNTGNALRSIYNEALIQIINQDRRNNPQSSSIATISQTHNITKDQFDAIVNPLLESTLDYGASSDGKNILNEEREVLSNNDAYIFPNSIKTIGNPYTSRIMMLVEDIEDKLLV